MTNFAEKILAPKIDLVIYITSDEDGTPTYFYVAVNGKDFKKLKQQIKENKIDLKSCNAKILESGYGEPSFEVREFMQKTYGCRSDVTIKIKEY